MREHITEVLKAIEKDHQVKILYACESGSRAWGFPSKDSDYDVRFLYVHKLDWHLSIDKKRDVIEVPRHDRISIPVDDLLDVSGWELTKALRLFRKSNPPLLEWLRSGMVYYQSGSAVQRLSDLSKAVFSPVSGIYHYLNMARGNYREYLLGENVKIKKYFYVLRPVLAAKWIEERGSFPPMEFGTLVEELLPDGGLKDEIHLLLKRKMAGDELNLEPRIDVINEFLDEELIRLENYAKSLDSKVEDPTPELNKLFRDILEEAWR